MKINMRTMFPAFLIVLFAYAAFVAKDFSRGAEVFPLAVALPALILCLIEFAHDARTSKASEKQDFVDIAVDDSTPTRVAYLGALKYLAWILGLYAVGWVLGFKIAITLFFLLFLKIEGHTRWPQTLLVTAIAAYLVLVHLSVIMGIYWPDYLLQPWISKIPLIG